MNPESNLKGRVQELTRAELEIMQILWRKERALVRDILDAMPTPKPAYNTVSTIVRILEQKGFVGHTAWGRTHEYYPLVEREEYTEHFMNGVLGNFFDGSLVQMVSFFAQRDNLSMGDFESIMGVLEAGNKSENAERPAPAPAQAPAATQIPPHGKARIFWRPKRSLEE